MFKKKSKKKNIFNKKNLKKKNIFNKKNLKKKNIFNKKNLKRKNIFNKKNLKRKNIFNKKNLKKKNIFNKKNLKKKNIFNKKNLKKKNIFNKKKINTENKKKNKLKEYKKKIIKEIKKHYKNNNKKYIRPPIITIMGHVNHGKTSLIKCLIKKKNIKEKGNITQSINTYYVNNKYLNFTILDTPGHSIFTEMRLKSLKITDIIILIISIDDGIMNQTKEIIKYVKNNNIPVIIVLNKIDKKLFKKNIKIIKKKISNYGFIPKEWGGNNIFIEISTKSKKGIKKIIKNILLLSKKINLNTNINKNISSGTIIESGIDKKKGPINHIITKLGILKIGDIILYKYNYGKIKCIYDNKNKKINKILPSIPVKILGLPNENLSGKKFITIKNLKLAKKIIKLKKKILLKKNNNYKYNIKNLFKKENKNKINIIIKSDTYGSLNIIKKWIKKKLENEINIISYSIGNINKNDLILLKTTKSIIFAYNIKIDNLLKINIKNNKKKIYFFKIIYKLFDKIKKIIKIKENKKNKKKYLGKAIIKNIFKISKHNLIAGCKILKGKINKNNYINIIRKKKIIHKGKIKSIKQFKKNIEIAKKNMECGINIKNFYKIKIGDIILSI